MALAIGIGRRGGNANRQRHAQTHPSSTLDVLHELGLSEISKPLGLVHAFDEPFAIRMDHLDATPISSLCLCEDLNQFPLCVVVSTPTSFLFVSVREHPSMSSLCLF
jgi:hypothetical protein